jgi:hypothetical protein
MCREPSSHQTTAAITDKAASRFAYIPVEGPATRRAPVAMVLAVPAAASNSLQKISNRPFHFQADWRCANSGI